MRSENLSIIADLERKAAAILARNIAAWVETDPMEREIDEESEREMWESWLRGDLIAMLPASLQDVADEMIPEALWQCYRDAMESTGTYPASDHDGWCVNIDAIAETFTENVRELSESTAQPTD